MLLRCAVLIWAVLMASGCAQTCDGSPSGVLRITNLAPIGEGPVIVGLEVRDARGFRVRELGALLLPGEAVDYVLGAGLYEVEVQWAGGVIALFDIDVAATDDMYELDLGFLFNSDEEDPWPPDDVSTCPLEVTELGLSPP